jgi:D-aminoacyl-tRNA deacylase
MMPSQPAATYVLVSSVKDPASMNMTQQLANKHGFKSTEIALFGRPVFQRESILLTTIGDEIISPPDLDKYFNPQAYVFLSRHWAESGVLSLTAHTTGNFTSEAALGGKPRELGWVNPNLLKNYMISLMRRRDRVKEFQITVEATHHGPTSLQKPVLFVEIGSTPKQWNDSETGNLVTEALMESLLEPKSWENVGLGVGGTHYPEKFTKLLTDSEYALASIAPKHTLEEMNLEMFSQMIQKSTKFVKYVAIDAKGLGKHKQKILELANRFALELIKL